MVTDFESAIRASSSTQTMEAQSILQIIPGSSLIRMKIHSRLPRFLAASSLAIFAGAFTLSLHAPSVHAAGQAAPAAQTPARAGEALFQQNCSFCHGRDAQGGETGPDLTRSQLVLGDKDGSKITEVVRNGRLTTEKKMPPFVMSDSQMTELIAFIRERVKIASSNNGHRRGVEVADLQTGNVDAGKQYFNGAGGCSKCHSATGDLAGIASRYKGLQLEERMLYPRDAKSKVTVTLPSGEKVTGELAYLDEFTVGLRDASDTYRSWSIPTVKYAVDSPVEAHVEQFPKYSDADIHNLMAYLQTLR